MKLEINNEVHEELSVEWQYQIILLFQNTLKKNGVETDLSKEIVGDFSFDLAMLHDQGEIKFSGKSYNPKICFDDFSGKLLAADIDSNLHEYAFGSASEAFGE